MPHMNLLPVNDDSILAHILTRLDELSDGMGEVKGELVANGMVGQKTFEQATKTNGRMARAEQRLDEHERWHIVAEATARGASQVREGDKAQLARLWQRVERPVLYGIAGVGLGAGGVVVSVLLHVARQGRWPW